MCVLIVCDFTSKIFLHKERELVYYKLNKYKMLLLNLYRFHGIQNKLKYNNMVKVTYRIHLKVCEVKI